MTRWLKYKQNSWWERICIHVLCSEARLVLFWLCSWDIYEVPDAHYTSLMRNHPGKCWFSWLPQCTGLPIMEPKLPGNYDWIGISVYLCLFHFQRGRSDAPADVCFVFIGISIDLEMMLGGTEKVHFGTRAVGELRAAWDSIKGNKQNMKLLHKKNWKHFKGEKRTVGYHSCCCWFILVRNEKFCPFSPETRLNRSSLEVYVRWWPWVAIIFMMGANEEDRWCDKVYMEEVGGDVCVVWNQKLLLTWFQLV